MIKNRIKVVDTIMGSGKTSWAVEHMNENSFGRNYIYITPYLDEVERIKKSVTNKHFYAPINKGEGKLDNLKDLVLEQKDIVATHKLFQMADEELIELISYNNYILILDEVMNVIEQVPLQQDDFRLLKDNEIITIDSEDFIIWNDEKGYEDTRYNLIRNMSKNKNLMFHRNSVLMWTFPASCFKAFDEVYILTYLFNAQYQKYYYDMFGLEYEYFGIKQLDEKYILTPKEEMNEDKSQLKKLITIYEGKLNAIGDSNSLSSTWLKNRKNNRKILQLKNNTYNFFRTIVKSKSKDNMWTTLLVAKDKLKGKGYTLGFVSHNTRATNDYARKRNIAYLLNKFMNPMEKSFFEDRGIKVDEEKWALSELLQWIWRSAIRKNQEVTIYLPSKRMRDLFVKWLES
ncbi:hypothetical protein [Anaeromicrobium sediminis]|uniref:Helicase/UvrB N-terminal domain-containing protein n=1 Tax=Anaeromicrobium sediminis TaxID=1478221 RepID=A0A267MMW0_9FIRM|nr:hypothetical protein [Anaeromicrobium sediminis]PAB60876.1 hypothetical protein CCE28_00130 [Anaeromicrobium sediminis]